jgi:hypothetical protein
MFRATSYPSSGVTTTAVAASGLPSELGGSSAVGPGRGGPSGRPRPSVLLSPSSDGKPKAATAVVVAADNGHEDARNLLSCLWFYLQLDALNSCLFTYNTFIKLLYMFRALTLLIIRGPRRNCVCAASGIVTLCR